MTVEDLATESRIGYSYLRVSSAGQAGERRDGLDRQLAAFPEFCRRHGLTPAPNVWIDAGLSAFRGSHRRKGALGRFLDAADAGQVPAGAVLVVEDLDRFSREAPSEALRLLLNEFFGLDLALGVVRFNAVIDRQEFNRQGSAAAIQLLVAMGTAHDYSAKLSDRVGSAWDRRRRDAHAGEKYKAARPFWCDWDEDSQDFVLNKHAEIPRRIVALCIEGYGTTHIARMLNGEGFTTTTGGHFSAGWVGRILRDPALIGDRVWGARAKRPGQPVEVLHGFFPAVITREEWDRSRLALEERARNPGRRGRGDQIHNLFQGVVFCPCGGRMTLTRARRGDRVRQYLRCLRREVGACQATSGSIPYDEQHLLRLFMRQRWSKLLAPSTGKRSAMKAARDAVIAAEGAAAQAEQRLATARDNLTRAATSGEVSTATIEQVGRVVTAEAAATAAAQQALEHAREELRRLELQPTGAEAQRALRAQVGEFLADGLDDPEQRRRFNVWVATLGVRVVLTRTASAEVVAIVERDDGLSELQTRDTMFLIDENPEFVEQEAQRLAGILGGTVVRPQ